MGLWLSQTSVRTRRRSAVKRNPRSRHSRSAVAIALATQLSWSWPADGDGFSALGMDRTGVLYG